jgi:F-type H+-transporting ATPase subunit a
VAAGADGGHSPIAQFELKTLVPLKIFGVDASFTNSSLFMLLATGLVITFLMSAMRGRSLVPTRLQSVAEMIYEFVAGTVRENVGEKGMKFFPLVFALFIFVLILNLMGMVPGGFTVTSHIIITAAMALMVIGIVILYGIAQHGLSFFKLFVPSDVPVWLLPLLVPIEVISFISRPISLSVRLFANMLAGHIALKIFAGFCWWLGAARAAAACADRRTHRARIPRSRVASLRFRRSNLHLPQRCRSWRPSLSFALPNPSRLSL